MDAIPQVSSKNARLNYIDCAKGIGILLVVIGHHLQDAASVRHWINSFHMPLFFIVSGYLFSYQDKTCSGIIIVQKAVKSLLYPYCAFSAVLIIWHILFYGILKTTPEEPLLQVVIESASTYGYHALWFLPALFWASIISKLYGNRQRIYLFVGTLLPGVILSYLSNQPAILGSFVRYVLIYWGRILVAVSFIEIGRFLYFCFEKMSSKTEWIVLLSSVSISLVGYRYNIETALSLSRIGNTLVYYPVACAGSVFVILLCKKFQNSSLINKFALLGRDSLVVMALHMDISIEIAWMILGITGIAKKLSFRMASVYAITIELVILRIVCLLINRYFPWLISPKRVNR